MILNMNDTVYVRLTKAGKAYHREHITKLRAKLKIDLEYRPPDEDEGWSRWQLWCLMEEFGPGTHLWSPLLFEHNEIRTTKPEEPTT